ncbi:MAG: glycosyltransferase [Bacteroidota bacterium]
MKICFVANAESIHTVRWVSYFVNRGHEVHLISHKGRNIEGVVFHSLKTIGKSRITLERIRLVNLLTFIIRSLQTRKLIHKIKPDIIHAHNVILSGFYTSLSKMHPMVVTAWGTDVLIAPKMNVVLKKIAKQVLKHADCITCDGLNTREAMIALGARADKINTIFFGIDTKKNSPSQIDESLKQKLNITDYPSVISIRNFNPVYNVETLVRAIPLVLNKIPDTKFILTGTGTEENNLIKLAGFLQVDKSIVFTGNLASDDIPYYLASADLYVSTSLSDSGLAASTGEAMACALPVIVTDVGDNRQWIQDGKNGYIIPVKNAEVLAAKIVLLLQNKKQMKEFGKANRKIILERQNYFKEMEKMEQICLNLVENYK